jgi:hypothetical protein
MQPEDEKNGSQGLKTKKNPEKGSFSIPRSDKEKK